MNSSVAGATSVPGRSAATKDSSESASRLGATSVSASNVPVKKIVIAPEKVPRREVEFTVRVPGNTLAGERVYLLLKPMVDWWWSEDTHIPMTDNGDGSWSTTAEVPEGGLVQYVYDRWDEQEWGDPFKEYREGAGRALVIESWYLQVTPGQIQVSDTVEKCQDQLAVGSVGYSNRRIRSKASTGQ